MPKRIPAWLFSLSLVLIVMGIYILRSHQRTTDIEDNQFLLDTVVSIKLYQSRDEALLQSAFDYIAEMEGELSRYQPHSEISRINNSQTQSWVKVSENTFQVLETALVYAEFSKGEFDPTIGPLVDIWGIGGESPQIPSNIEIARILPLIDYKTVNLNSERKAVMLMREGVRLDIGGIAKGWIADEIANYLHENGARHILINLGGNIRIMGGKPDGKPFRIGMQDPFGERGSYLGVFSLSEGSVVSSGVYERFFEADGIRYHHILDTETGYPVDKGLAAVTIISPYSVDGDALSTTLLAMGLERGIELVKRIDHIEAVFITTEGDIFITSDAARIFEPTHEELSMQIY